MCTTQLQVSEETNRKCQAYWSWVRNNSECPFVFWETHSCHLQKQQALLSVTLSECFFFFLNYIYVMGQGVVCVLHLVAARRKLCGVRFLLPSSCGYQVCRLVWQCLSTHVLGVFFLLVCFTVPIFWKFWSLTYINVFVWWDANGSLGADIKWGSEPPDVGPWLQTGNAFLTTSAPSLAPSMSALEFCELF